MITCGNFKVELIKHSATSYGNEVLTFEWTYERFIHAEVLRHRCASNYSSSRAIAFEKMLTWTDSHPAMPLHLGKNQKGMQSSSELVDNADDLHDAILERWIDTKEWMVDIDNKFEVHKEIINRYGEVWGWITGIATMGISQFMNFVGLRCTPYANPSIQRLAISALREYVDSTPQILSQGDWHVPLFEDYVPHGSVLGFETYSALVWSVARCCFVSYNNTHKEISYEKAMGRHNSCVQLGHFSPMEHQLQVDKFERHGIVPGFKTYRSMVPGEMVIPDIKAILDRYEGRDFILPD